MSGSLNKVVMVNAGCIGKIPEAFSKDYFAWISDRTICVVDMLPDSNTKNISFFSSYKTASNAGFRGEERSSSFTVQGIAFDLFEDTDPCAVIVSQEEATQDRAFFSAVAALTHLGCSDLVTIGFEVAEDKITKSELAAITEALNVLADRGAFYRALDSVYSNNMFNYFSAPKLKSENTVIDINDRAEIDKAVRILKQNLAVFHGSRVYFTLVSNGYEWGGINVTQSLLEKNHYSNVVVLYTGDVDLDLLRHNLPMTVLLVEVPVIIRPEKNVLPRYFNTLSKFFIFSLEGLERAVFVESDLLIRRDISSLLDHDDRIVATNSYNTSGERSMIHPCVMSFRPSMQVFNDVLQTIRDDERYNGQGDHGYFISYFKDQWDDSETATTKFNWSQTYLGSETKDLDIAIVHLHGIKPWDRAVGRGAYLAFSKYYDEWLKNFTRQQLLGYMNGLRKQEVMRECINTVSRLEKKAI